MATKYNKKAIKSQREREKKIHIYICISIYATSLLKNNVCFVFTKKSIEYMCFIQNIEKKKTQNYWTRTRWIRMIIFEKICIFICDYDLAVKKLNELSVASHDIVMD